MIPIKGAFSLLLATFIIGLTKTSKAMHLINRYKETISDGPGLRYSLYLAGCRHRCPGCHNSKSWDPRAGVELKEEVLADIIDEINANSLLDGITISGGDPFFNPIELTELLRTLKEQTALPILVYTGFTIELLEAIEELQKPLRYIDILIDGPYVHTLHDASLPFRGSKNQRIIDLNLRYNRKTNAH